jgi:hypothetical protein
MARLVTDKIDGSTVAAPQVRAYSASNSTGGTQIGPVYRLHATDRMSVPFDSKYLERGETLSIAHSACSTLLDIVVLHEEF